jgi:hypothetical protein
MSEAGCQVQKPAGSMSEHERVGVGYTNEPPDAWRGGLVSKLILIKVWKGINVGR